MSVSGDQGRTPAAIALLRRAVQKADPSSPGWAFVQGFEARIEAG